MSTRSVGTNCSPILILEVSLINEHKKIRQLIFVQSKWMEYVIESQWEMLQQPKSNDC